MFKALILIWLAAVTIGFWVLESHAAKAGTMGPQVQKWVDRAELPLNFDQENLVVFVHPRCSCTQATLDELERVMTHIHAHVHLSFVFYKPSTEKDSWVETTYWRRAKAMHPDNMVVDADGRLAKTLGVQTSGQITLFDQNRKLVYAGGITPARGHTGDSYGRLLLLQHFDSPGDFGKIGSVYGCSLQSKNTRTAAF